MNTYNDYWVDNYLSHYGVLGMRWRKRKGYSNYTRSVIQRNKIEQERAMKKLQSPKINSNKVSSMTRRLDNGLDMERRSKQMDKLEKIFANKKDKKGKYRSARKITKDLENELERLTGEKFTLISEDTSPSGDKDFILYNPYKKRNGKKNDDAPSIHQETEYIFIFLLLKNVQTLCFTISRKIAELIAMWAKNDMLTYKK